MKARMPDDQCLFFNRSFSQLNNLVVSEEHSSVLQSGAGRVVMARPVGKPEVQGASIFLNPEILVVL